VQPESPPFSAGAVESDLDTTAELPVLDTAEYEASAEARTGGTDTWITPAPPLAKPSAQPESPAANLAAGVAAAAPPRVGEDQQTQLEISLQSLTDNLREAQERLEGKGERLAEIERALAQAQTERAAAEQLSRQLTRELTQARSATATAEARLTELQRTRQVAADRVLPHEKQFEEQLALRDKALALVQQDLTRAQAVAASYLESLRSLEGRRGIFEHLATSLCWELDTRDTQFARTQEQLSATTSRTRDMEAALAERMADIATLEKQVKELTTAVAQRDEMLRQAAEELNATSATQRKRAELLESELATVRAELQQRVAALQAASTERGEHMARIAAGDARIEDLEGRIVEQQESVRTLQVDSNASVARARELEGDLRAAEDMIHRLEGELRSRNARLDELERTTQHWRVTVEEARNALMDRDSLIRRLEEETANSAVLLGTIQQRLDASGIHEQMPEGDTRLLIRTEGESEIVHVLGRKTSVGRTPDNDLYIDAKYISRHHAVILAAPAHTIIEDLNSTNGVLVNGRRITRQTLRDGDSVMIGKTLFRFAVRPAMERRA
jgi:FHA domain